MRISDWSSDVCSSDLWAVETPLELAIERLGDAKSAPIAVDEMAARATQHALGDLYLYFWFQNVWSGLTPNSITAPQAFRGAGGGLVTQGISNGSRSEEHTSELQSLMRISYAVFCLKKTRHNKSDTESKNGKRENRNERPNND